MHEDLPPLAGVTVVVVGAADRTRLSSWDRLGREQGENTGVQA